MVSQKPLLYLISAIKIKNNKKRQMERVRSKTHAETSIYKNFPQQVTYTHCKKCFLRQAYVTHCGKSML